MLKLKGLKKAVGDFQRANKGGHYDPRYGKLMLDRSTGELWTDEFYSIGHNTWKEYKDESIINLVKWIDWEHPEKATGEVNMENVKKWAEIAINEYNK
jgi:hypothetical protein